MEITLNEFIEQWITDKDNVAWFEEEHPDLEPGTDLYFTKMYEVAELDYEAYKADSNEANFLANNF